MPFPSSPRFSTQSSKGRAFELALEPLPFLGTWTLEGAPFARPLIKEGIIGLIDSKGSGWTAFPAGVPLRTVRGRRGVCGRGGGWGLAPVASPMLSTPSCERLRLVWLTGAGAPLAAGGELALALTVAEELLTVGGGHAFALAVVGVPLTMSGDLAFALGTPRLLELICDCGWSAGSLPSVGSCG